MQGPGLPIWALWIQALGLPIFGGIIAAVGQFLGFQQKRLADIRLQNDLYDRRFKIYEAAKTLLVHFQLDGNVQLEDYFAFVRATSESVFLLSPDVVAYLE